MTLASNGFFPAQNQETIKSPGIQPIYILQVKKIILSNKNR